MWGKNLVLSKRDRVWGWRVAELFHNCMQRRILVLRVLILLVMKSQYMLLLESHISSCKSTFLKSESWQKYLCIFRCNFGRSASARSVGKQVLLNGGNYINKTATKETRSLESVRVAKYGNIYIVIYWKAVVNNGNCMHSY